MIPRHVSSRRLSALTGAVGEAKIKNLSRRECSRFHTALRLTRSLYEPELEASGRRHSKRAGAEFRCSAVGQIPTPEVPMVVQSTRRFSIPAILIAIALVASIALSVVRPAVAETAVKASTRNIILGAVAAATAIILYNNYEHKKAAANTIVGRT